jgi:hypothetical protein
MKKIIYAILLTFSIALATTSCTEEEVTPDTEIVNNGGGSGDGQKI